MAAEPGSPNRHWQQLGYTIERVPVIHPRTGKPTEYRRRVIRRPDGSVVEIDQRPGEDYAAAEVRVAEEECLVQSALWLKRNKVSEAPDQSPNENKAHRG